MSVTKKKNRSKVKPKQTPKKVTRHLDKQNINFELVPHRKVYTAYDLAQTLGIDLQEIAKTLLLKISSLPSSKTKIVYYIVVLPASYRVDLQKVCTALKAEKVELASEKVFVKLGLEPGSISPFGSLYGFNVIVDRGLLKSKLVLVSTESLVESLRLQTDDLIKLEQATIASIGIRGSLKKVKKQVKKVDKKKNNSGQKLPNSKKKTKVLTKDKKNKLPLSKNKKLKNKKRTR